MLKIFQQGKNDIYIAWNANNKSLELKLIAKNENEISYNLSSQANSSSPIFNSIYSNNEIEFQKDAHSFNLKIKNKNYKGYYFIDPNHFYLHFRGNTYHLKPKSWAKMESSSGDLISEMPGKIINILKNTGDEISNGDTIFQVESMKMENNILANRSGKLGKILVKIGQEIKSGEILSTII